VRFPEEQGIGAVPVCSAKAASERNCWLPGVADQDRGGQRAAALLVQELGVMGGHALGQLAVQRVDLAVQRS
jgi:hypothetical protein